MEGVLVEDRAVGSLTHDRLKGCDNCSPLGNIKVVDAERKPYKETGTVKKVQKGKDVETEVLPWEGDHPIASFNQFPATTSDWLCRRQVWPASYL